MNVIEIYRKRNNLSQEEFAKIIGVSQPHLANIENGIRKISNSIAYSIEKATNGEIKAEWLVFPEKYREEIEEYLNKNLVGASK